MSYPYYQSLPDRTGYIDKSVSNRKPLIYSQYFSGNDANIHLYSGEQGSLISECKALGYDLNEKVMPLYGYASYTPDAWARGSRIITGMFTVNMLGVNYLYDIIGNDQTQFSSSPAVDPESIQGKKNVYWIDSPKEDTNITYKYAKLSNKPYFKTNSFLILISYKISSLNTTDEGINNFLQSIDDVHIMSVAMQMDISGKPIEQTYMFMAGDINRHTRSKK